MAQADAEHATARGTASVEHQRALASHADELARWEATMKDPEMLGRLAAHAHGELIKRAASIGGLCTSAGYLAALWIT